MRKLNTSDVFSFCRVVKNSNAREELRKIVAQAAKDKEMAKKAKENGENIAEPNVIDVGVSGFMAIIESCVEPKTEAAIYQFLAGPMECTPEEVRDMPLDQFLVSLKQLAQENNLKAFFDSASGILGKN